MASSTKLNQWFWGGLFAILLCLATFNNTRGQTLNRIGDVAIFAMLSTGVLLLILQLSRRRSLQKATFALIIPASLFSLVYLIGLTRDTGVVGYKITILTVMSLLYFLFACLYKWKGPTIKSLGYFASAFVVVNTVLYALGIEFSPVYQHGFSGYFSNRNGFAAFTFLLLAWVTVARARRGYRISLLWWTVGAGGFFLVYVAQSRAVWLAVLAALVTYVLWPLLSRRKSLFKGYLVAVAACIVGVIGVGLILTDLYGIAHYNQIVVEYTGEQLKSGREMLWPYIVDAIAQHPFVGHGPGTIATDVVELGLTSAHNYYLQVLLQVGIVGFAPLLILFWNIWKLFWTVRSDPIIRVVGASFIGILVHQNFEVSLTHNNLAIGMLAWMIIALGVSVALRRFRMSEVTRHTAAAR